MTRKQVQIFYTHEEILPRAHRAAMPEEYIPYEFVHHISKLDHVGLPPKEAFYSVLYKENVSDENYEHALLVFKNHAMRVVQRLSSYILKNRCFTIS